MPQTLSELYFPILVQVIIAAVLASALVGLTGLLGKRSKSPLKDTPYESGMAPVGSAQERFSVRRRHRTAIDGRCRELARQPVDQAGARPAREQREAPAQARTCDPFEQIVGVRVPAKHVRQVENE